VPGDEFQPGVATHVDHVEVVELGKQPSHELGRDVMVLIRRQDLEEGDERAEHAVADRRCVSDERAIIDSQDHGVAATKACSHSSSPDPAVCGRHPVACASVRE
jgi:hypothetical protein